jgi:ubiquinone/menaquinone biosynthesis C-methylase UbiE
MDLAMNKDVHSHFSKLAEEGVWASLYAEEDHITAETWSFVIRARRVTELLQIAGTSIGSVVDIGCGTAPIARSVSAMGCHYTGVDFSSDMIDAARRNISDLVDHGKAHLVVGEATRLSLPDRTCDAVIAMGVLEYLTQPAIETMLDETARVLRPGGVVILTIPKRHHWGAFVLGMLSPLRRLVRSVKARSLKLTRPERFERLYLTSGELDEACRRAGFQKVDHRHYNFQPICRPATEIAPRLTYVLNRPFEALARVPGASFLGTGYIGMYRRPS